MKYSNPQKEKQNRRTRRHVRVRAKIAGTLQVPRLSVYRSLKRIQAQIIDDIAGKTLVAASTYDIAEKQRGETVTTESGVVYTTKVAQAFRVGELIGKRAQEKGIKRIVFDKGAYKYHGRVRAVAEGARAAGLEF